MTWMPPGAEFPNYRTYSFGTPLFTAPATPTDLLVIKGAAGKKLILLELSGIYIGTANATSVAGVLIVRRSADDTGAGNAVTLVPHLATDTAASAGVRYFTTNPSGLGAIVGNVGSGVLQTSIPGNGNTGGLTSPSGQTLLYSSNPNGKGLQLASATEIIAVNFNGISLNATGAQLGFSGVLMEID